MRSPIVKQRDARCFEITEDFFSLKNPKETTRVLRREGGGKEERETGVLSSNY